MAAPARASKDTLKSHESRDAKIGEKQPFKSGSGLSKPSA